MAAIEIVTGLTVVLLLGLLVSLISKRLRIPNVLFLLVLGFVLGLFTMGGKQLFYFEPDLLLGLSIIALAIIVFYGASSFEFRALDSNSTVVLRLVSIFLVLNLGVLTIVFNWLSFGYFSLSTVLLSVIFAALMSGTDAATVLSIFKDKTNNVLDFLKIEAVFNTPLTVLIPFLILDLLENIHFDQNSVVNTLAISISPFLLNILVGIGAGVLVGLIMLRALRKFYHASLSPVIMVTSALLSYVLAENLSGNGVIAAATLGMFFGNFAIRQKESLQEFNLQLSSILEILVFVMVGLIININLQPIALFQAFILFLIMVIIRWVSLLLSLPKDQFSHRERTFIILNMPKGLAVAVVILTIGVTLLNNATLASTVLADGLQQVLDMAVLVTILSLIVTSIMSILSKKFIRIKLQ